MKLYMKKIYCLLLFVVCSQAYGQIHLDSATYYSLMSNTVWVHTDAVEWNDSLEGTPCGPNTLLIDSNYYRSSDSHCMEIRLSYELQINDTLFILHVKDTYIGGKFDFYFYGWFVDDSTLQVIKSNNSMNKNKIKEAIPDTYKRYKTKP